MLMLPFHGHIHGLCHGHVTFCRVRVSRFPYGLPRFMPCTCSLALHTPTPHGTHASSILHCPTLSYTHAHQSILYHFTPMPHRPSPIAHPCLYQNLLSYTYNHTSLYMHRTTLPSIVEEKEREREREREKRPYTWIKIVSTSAHPMPVVDNPAQDMVNSFFVFPRPCSY
jgi:hypothetical protein